MTAISISLLYDAIFVLVGLVVATLAAASCHAAWLAWARRYDRPRLARARAVLAAELAAEPTAEAAAEPVAGSAAGPAAGSGPVNLDERITALPSRLRRQLVVELADSLRGAQRRRLADIAADLGVVGQARRLAGSRWWWRRLRGAYLLSSLHERDPVVHRLLVDRHPAVRAEAIIWAGDNLDAALADRVVELLADDSALCRNAARDALLRAGPAAAPAVVDHLRRGETTDLLALLDVAAARPDQRYQLAARVLATDALPAIRAAAVALLGTLGGEDDVPVLEGRLGDRDTAVRQAAATALGRLGHWPAAPAVARLLRDGSWEVRQAAGEALIALGAPGALMLRQYARDDDPFAADMAQRITQLARLRAVRTREASR